MSRDMFVRVLGMEKADLDFSKILQSINCSKAFYYDCLDEQRSGEDLADFRQRRKSQEDDFEAIRALPGYHVIEGTLAGKRQKEVDVALAVDMLTHAYNRNMGWAHLIAGDLDFRPLVQALVRLGIYVTVWSGRTSTSKALQRAADNSHEIRFSSLYHWCLDDFRTAHPIPTMTGEDTPFQPYRVVKEGPWPAGGRATLYQLTDDSFCVQVLGIPKAAPFRITDRRQDLLENFVQIEYGPVEWR